MDEALRRLRTKYRLNLRGLGAMVGLIAVTAVLARVFSPDVGAAFFVGFILVMTIVVIIRPRPQDLDGMGGPDGAVWIGGGDCDAGGDGGGGE